MAAQAALIGAGFNLMACFLLLVVAFALAGEAEHGRDVESLAAVVRWIGENVLLQPAWSIWGDKGGALAFLANLAVWGLVPGLLVGLFVGQKDMDEWEQRSEQKAG